MGLVIVGLPALVWVSYTRCIAMSNQTRSSEIDSTLVRPCADGTIGACVGDGNITGIPRASARLRVREAVQPEPTGSKVEIAVEPSALAAVFGVGDPDVATHLLNQLVRVLHP